MGKPDYSTLADGCDGDSEGLRDALGDDYEVLYEHGEHKGWGHHGSNAVFRVGDRFIHASCGGCSCGGSGSWDWCTLEEAKRLVPSEERGPDWDEFEAVQS